MRNRIKPCEIGQSTVFYEEKHYAQNLFRLPW